MYFLLKVMSLSLLLLLAVWISVTIRKGVWTNPTLHVDRIQVIGFGTASVVSQAEVEAAIERAILEMDRRYAASNKLKLISYCSAWGSCLATAVITLICGYFGRPPADQNAMKELVERSVKLTRVLGLLAALAAILTVLSSRLDHDSEDRYRSATTLKQGIEETYQTIGSTDDPTLIRKKLVDLHAATESFASAQPAK
jgi:hypothetical protein